LPPSIFFINLDIASSQFIVSEADDVVPVVDDVRNHTGIQRGDDGVYSESDVVLPVEAAPGQSSSRSRLDRWRRARKGFTLLELLTVIAIIGILSTLMASVLGSAKKSSHRARCISNLHQISLSLHMYLDDFTRRPPDYFAPVVNRYLANSEVLRCPADKYGGWGNLVQPSENYDMSYAMAAPAPGAEAVVTNRIQFSYLHPLGWQDVSWQALVQKGGLAGLAACQLHGLGRPNPDLPSIHDFQGLVLRAQYDGAVVKRQVFWDNTTLDSIKNANMTLVPGTAGGASANPWQLFSDEPIP